MQWTCSRQSIAKERRIQDTRGWRVWIWYEQLGPVIVTATVAPTPLGRATAPVTVITREQIVAVHLTYLQTDIKETTEKLRKRPQWRGGFAV